MFASLVWLALLTGKTSDAYQDSWPHASWSLVGVKYDYPTRIKGEILIRAVRLGLPQNVIERLFGSPTIREEWKNPAIWHYTDYCVGIRWKTTPQMKLHYTNVHGGLK